MIGALRDADDLFFGIVSQIHLPRWSQGRSAWSAKPPTRLRS
ncbi:hypothetical protein ACFQ73_39370 [Amycolatopsis japonica]